MKKGACVEHSIYTGMRRYWREGEESPLYESIVYTLTGRWNARVIPRLLNQLDCTENDVARKADGGRIFIKYISARVRAQHKLFSPLSRNDSCLYLLLGPSNMRRIHVTSTVIHINPKRRSVPLHYFEYVPWSAQTTIVRCYPIHKKASTRAQRV